MRAIPALLFCMLLANNLTAQVSNNSYRVPYDTDITKTLPAKDRFLFENFRKGIVYFRNGKRSEAPLNYNFIHAEVEFINAKNDTLLLADKAFVRDIVVDGLLFYYCPNQGHVLQIGDFNKIRLCKKEQMTPSGTEHSSTYGKHFSAASVSSFVGFTEIKGVAQPLKSGNYAVMKKVARYFFMDQNDRFHPASWAGLTKIFPKHTEEINRYVKENNIDFYNEKDLVELVEHCKSF